MQNYQVFSDVAMPRIQMGLEPGSLFSYVLQYLFIIFHPFQAKVQKGKFGTHKENYFLILPLSFSLFLFKIS